MAGVLGRWLSPAVILVPALGSLVLISGTIGMAVWGRVLVVVLWLGLATIALRRSAARSQVRSSLPQGHDGERNLPRAQCVGGS